MSKLTKEAQGRECQVRLPGICNHDPATTVLAHYRLSGTCGIGMKPPDNQGTIACSACHDAIDGRLKTEYSREELRLFHAEAVMQIQQIWINEGLMK